MKRFFRLAMISLSSILLLLVTSVIIILLTVNPDRYREQLCQWVSAKTGRQFAIQGHLSWGLSVQPEFKLTQASLSNRPGFGPQPFAIIKEAYIQIDLWSLLLHGQLEIHKLNLRGLKLQLSENQQKENNWQDILHHIQQPAKKSLTNPYPMTSNPTGIQHLDITLEQATVDWLNSTSLPSKLSSTTTDNLQSYQISLIGKIQGHQSRFSSTFKLNSKLQLNTLAQRYEFNQLQLHGQYQDAAILKPLRFALTTNLRSNLVRQKLQLKPLALTIGNLHASGYLQAKLDKEVWQGQLQVTRFNLIQLLEHLGKPLPPLQKPDSLQKVSGSIELLTDASTLALNKIAIAWDNSHLQGSLNIPRKTGAKTANVQLAIDKLPLNDYLEPTAEPMPLCLTGLQFQGILDWDKRVIKGLLAIADLQLANFHANTLSTQLLASQTLFNADKITAQLYQGRYTGRLSINRQTNQPLWNLQQRFSKVHLAPLLQDSKALSHIQVAGIADLETRLSTKGNKLAQIKRHLTGQMKFAVKQGVLKGIDLEYWLAVGSALYHQEKPPTITDTKQTRFQLLTGSFAFINGVAINKDLLLQSAFMRATGQGQADLVQQQLDYRINIMKMNPQTQQPRQDIIPLHLYGPFDTLTIRPDMQALLKNQARKELQKHETQLKQRLSEQAEKHLGKAAAEQLKQLNLEQFFK